MYEIDNFLKDIERWERQWQEHLVRIQKAHKMRRHHFNDVMRHKWLVDKKAKHAEKKKLATK